MRTLLKSLLVAGAVTALVVLWPPAATTSERQTPSPRPPEPEIYRDAEHRLSYAIPAGWQRATASLTPSLVDPVEVLSVGTGDLRPGGQDCGHTPENAARAMSAGDALVSVQETSPKHFSARNQPFDLGVAQVHHQLAGCADRSDLDVRWTGFSEAGRGFYVLVAFGPGVSAERRAEAVGILDSLQVAR